MPQSHVKLLPAISKMISHITSSFTDIYSGTRGECRGSYQFTKLEKINLKVDKHNI